MIYKLKTLLLNLVNRDKDTEQKSSLNSTNLSKAGGEVETPPQSNESIIYPNISSTEHKNIEDTVRKNVRDRLKNGEPFDLDKLVNNEDVIPAAAIDFFPEELLKIMVLPHLDVRGFVWQEYLLRELWTIGEASCLSVGIDPLIYSIESSQYYPEWRQRREVALLKTESAIHNQDLRLISENGILCVKPQEFCLWAKNINLLTSELVKPILNLATNSTINFALTPEYHLEHFSNLAKQQYHLQLSSRAAQRRQVLHAFAVLAKYKDPALTRENIIKIAFNILEDNCKNLTGYKKATIKSDIFNLDKDLDNFLYITPSPQEIMNTDPTHHWWSRWRPVIAEKLPWLVLPE